jgi:flavin-dependent dehydrogenase
MLWHTAVAGIRPEGALVASTDEKETELVRARWVVGADGSFSRVRRWAELDRDNEAAPQNKSLRFGFRRHYHVAPWSSFMELHWGRRCQVYVTPVSRGEVCVALISSDPKFRLRNDDALDEFPELRARLRGANLISSERGATTALRKLRSVYRGHAVLVGDASGGVDAITGEGLCLAFRQALLLGDCLASADLAHYQNAHRSLLRRPTLMSHLMLFMAKHSHLRRRTMQVFRSNPRSFKAMLALHVGEGSARHHVSNGIALGWKLLKA